MKESLISISSPFHTSPFILYPFSLFAFRFSLFPPRSLQILLADLLGHDVKSRLPAEPTGPRSAYRLVGKLCILLLDLDGFPSLAARRRIRHQLRLTAFLEADEPEDGGLDRLPHSQQAMVLEKCGLAVAETVCDVFALLFSEDDAVELAVDGVVVMEGAGVLGDGVELAAEGAEGAAVDAVGVGGAEDVWPRGVYGVVDHVGGGVEEAVIVVAAIDDLAGGVDLDQVARLDQGEGQAERVDPEGGGVDGVAEGDVAGDAFVVAELAEDTEGEGQAAFEVGTFFVLVREGGWGRKLHHLRHGRLGVDLWFVRSG
jgi:hypothetical protein